MKSSIGMRMKKNYEKPFNIQLPMRIPVIIRLDGKAFHSLTKNMDKPFDEKFISMMILTANYLCKEIQGAVMAYIQSDEISILIHNYKNLDSMAWFDNKIQKISSVSAGLASAYFTQLINDEHFYKKNIFNNTLIASFDARVFVLPENEVCNYFIWRQRDWERNSIQMLARSLYSHNECHKKNKKDLHEMCFQKGKNWNDLIPHLKRGIFMVKNEYGNWNTITDTPCFNKNRKVIENLLIDEEK